MKTIGWFAAGGFFLVCLLQHFVIVRMEDELTNKHRVNSPIIISKEKTVEKTVNSNIVPMSCPYTGGNYR